MKSMTNFPFDCKIANELQVKNHEECEPVSLQERDQLRHDLTVTRTVHLLMPHNYRKTLGGALSFSANVID